MKVRAAIAYQAKAPLVIDTIDLDGPKEGEVLVEVKATGICHTDEYTLSGADPEGQFPVILGHEGAGVVVEVGRGVTSLKKGDHVIPLYTPECRQCKTCLSRKSNLCTAIRATQGNGVMPDGSSRFSCSGTPVLHYMGCSTFANFTVLPEIALAKSRPDAPFDKVCYIGCGVTTGVGAVLFTAKVEAGANVVVFGLGVPGAALAGTALFLALIMVETADLIFAVDSVPAVFAITSDPFLVYTSNIFAILGLRALYFALAAILHRFAYLKYALSVLLIFIGSKMFVADWLDWEKFPASLSLGITAAILTTGVAVSLWKTRNI